MNDGTQAYVNVISSALEKIMGDEDDESRATALGLLGRRIMRCGWEANVNPLEFAEPEWITEFSQAALDAA